VWPWGRSERDGLSRIPLCFNEMKMNQCYALVCHSDCSFKILPVGAKYKTETISPATSLASLWARVEPPAHHSTVLLFESLDVLVLYRYDHIHARLCGAGVAYTLRKS